MLIVNPFATSTTAAGRDELVGRLAAHIDLTVEHTTHRGHAGELGARARDQGYSAVIVHGGDGTVNEVVNGLLDPPNAMLPPAPSRTPAVGVIPGGSANVFARALGIDPDPLRATTQLVDLIGDDEYRSIGLGHADGRWFLFNAGLGVDANVIHSMEDQRTAGHTATDIRYVRTTVYHFLLAARRAPTLTVYPCDQAPARDIYYAFISNTTPWTYLGSRRIEINPATTFNGGLGLFASRSMGVIRNLPLITRLLTHREPKARHILRDDNVAHVRIVSSEPIDMQMDGDYLGLRSAVEFGCHPDVVRIIAPGL